MSGCPLRGIRRSPQVLVWGFRLKERRFRLVPTPHPRRAQMPSRLPPLIARAAQSCPQAAPLTNASLLPIGAVGLVPPLHDGIPPTCIPMITTPNAFSKSATLSVPRLADPTGLPRLAVTTTPALRLKLRLGGDIAFGHGVRCNPALTRGAGPSRTWNAPPVTLDLGPGAPLR